MSKKSTLVNHSRFSRPPLAAATKLTITRQPSTTATSGVALSTQPIIQVADAGGNPVHSQDVLITISLASGSDTLAGSSQLTDSNGTATFTDITLSGSGTDALSFAAIGLASVITTSISVTAVLTSDEPLYNPSLHTSLFQGDDSNPLYTTATNAGRADGGNGQRFCPFGPYLNSQVSVDPKYIAIGSSGGMTGGKILRLMYPSDTAFSAGGQWRLVNSPTFSASKAVYHTRYWKLVGTPIAMSDTFAIKDCHCELFNVNGGGAPQWCTHNTSPGPSITGLGTTWQFYDGGYTDELISYPGGHDQGNQPNAPYFYQLYGAGWIRDTVGYKSHSSSSNKDGFARRWINGTKIIDVSQAAHNLGQLTGMTKQWCSQAMVDNMHVNIAPDTNSWWWGGDCTDHPGIDIEIQMDINSFRSYRDI